MSIYPTFSLVKTQLLLLGFISQINTTSISNLRIGKKAIEQYDKVVAKITFFFEKLFEEIGQEGVDNIERYIDIAKKIGMQMKMENEKDA